MIPTGQTMARRRHKPLSVSLFPFLSVLACVIGVLTLMIAGLALAQIDPQSVEQAEQEMEEAQERADEMEQIQGQLRVKRGEANEVKNLIAQAQAIRDQLQAARDELKKLEQQRSKRLSQDALSVKLLAQAKRLRDRIAQLEIELKALLEKIKELEAELAKRKTPPKEATVRIQPGGSGTNLKPTFIECDGGTIVIYDGPAPHRVRRDDMPKDKRFLALLDRIADDEKRTIVFLVRENATYTYYRARDEARRRYARNGKLPVAGRGKIDLSIFEKK